MSHQQEAPTAIKQTMPFIWIETAWEQFNMATSLYQQIGDRSPGGIVHCHHCGAILPFDSVAALANHRFHHDADVCLNHFICKRCAPNRYRAAALAYDWAARLIETGDVGRAVRYEWTIPRATIIKGKHVEYMWIGAKAEPQMDMLS